MVCRIIVSCERQAVEGGLLPLAPPFTLLVSLPVLPSSGFCSLLCKLKQIDEQSLGFFPEKTRNVVKVRKAWS